MNKNIKFRVWDKKYEVWDRESDNFNEGLFSEYELEYYETYSACILTNEKYIIQQSTCKQDCNGKEIYEGDIVEYIEKMHEHGDAQKLTGIVVYDKYFCAYGISSDGVQDCMNYFTDMTVKHIKIIGNIIENKELLNK